MQKIINSIPGTISKTFRNLGYVHIPNVFSVKDIETIEKYVNEIEQWPQSHTKWIHSYEETLSENTIKSRTEFFIGYHSELANIILSGPIPQTVSETIEKDVLLFKEKINYKFPESEGYTAHQDAPAYRQVKDVTTCILPIDDANIESGCIEFVPGSHKYGLLPTLPGGTLNESLARQIIPDFEWKPLEVSKGDLVIFSSYTVHKSEKNTSRTPRRQLYITYNAAYEGYHRDEYYRNKRIELQNDSRISLINHFKGNTVSPAFGRAAVCESNYVTEDKLNDIRQLFDKYGDTYYEVGTTESSELPVTQLEHALQTAKLAEDNGASDIMVVTALLHDIGHFLNDEHTKMESNDFLEKDLHHEYDGYKYLRNRLGFLDEITLPIRLHVNAKRYLCFVDKDYYDSLSESSKNSLMVQGGPFTEEEATDFYDGDHNESAKDAVQIRLWDDKAKVPGKSTPSLDYFLERYVEPVLMSQHMRKMTLVSTRSMKSDLLGNLYTSE